MLGTKTDFAGRDGFNWWVGEVESVEDPASLGRVKVRIVGWHQKGKVYEPISSAKERPKTSTNSFFVCSLYGDNSQLMSDHRFAEGEPIY